MLSLSKGAEANKFAVLSVAAGLLAIVLGELGDVPGLISIVLVPDLFLFYFQEKTRSNPGFQ